MDILDRAQDSETKARLSAIEAAINRVGSGRSSEFYRECGEKIPEKRRLAVPGCQLCIECQLELET